MKLRVRIKAYENALPLLLKLIDWQGDPVILYSSKPYLQKISTAKKFSEVLDNLGYISSKFSVQMYEIDKRFFPCLFVSNKQILVLKAVDKKNIYAIDCATQEEVVFDAQSQMPGTIYCFKENKESQNDELWTDNILNPFRIIYWQAWLISLILSILGLGIPLFIMAVYNQVIGTYSIGLLANYLIGVGIVFIAMLILLWIRSHLLTWIGNKINLKVSHDLIKKILQLPSSFTENATIGSQVARIKEFEQVRDFISNPNFVILFELPYTIIFLIALGLIGKLLVLVPLIVVSIYIVLCLFSWFKNDTQLKLMRQAAHQKNESLVEILYKLKQIKDDSLINYFFNKFRNLSAIASIEGFTINIKSVIADGLSDLLTLMSGLVIVCLGAIYVINNELSLGGLIAIMILNWRILAPYKVCYTLIPTLKQFVASVSQIKRLMQLPSEKQLSIQSDISKFQGDVTFENVSFRYPQEEVPALSGINFSIKQGEVVAIMGSTGSGKSTLFKLILNLYQPQFGDVLLDQINIKQINPYLLRRKIAYMPQKPQFFYGTITENLLRASPLAWEQELQNIAAMVGIDQAINQLPDKFKTYINSQQLDKYGTSFSQGLNLARTYLKHSRIMLLDEPLSLLYNNQAGKFFNFIKAMRGNATILFSTHSPSAAKIADKVIILNKGKLVVSVKPDIIISKFTGSLL